MLFLLSISTTIVLITITIATNIYAYEHERAGGFLVIIKNEFFDHDLKALYITGCAVMLGMCALFLLPVLLLTTV
jgi:hypothetical protein